MFESRPKNYHETPVQGKQYPEVELAAAVFAIVFMLYIGGAFLVMISNGGPF